MGEVHALRVKSPYKLLHVEDIKIINRPSEHATLYLKCLIDDSIDFKYSIEASTKDEITVYEEKEKSTVLFNGLIKDIKTTNDNGVYYVEINGISKTCELDVKEKSRSFQNINMTYDNLISYVLKDYSCNNFIQSVGCGKKIDKPIFQYKETDWNFLKRICSHLNSEIYCDIINENNLFYFGMNSEKSYEMKDETPYKVCKDLKSFHKAGGYDAGFDDTDYFYYEVKSRERYNLGDKIYFKQKDVYVTEYAACKYQDEVIYKYRLCRKNGVWQTKLYNCLISGASLEGKVLAVQGEEVKLKLDIDKEQSEFDASWFKYAPPTGNTMYSMPIVGTNARLYFPDESGNEPLISGCVRNNGSSCAKTSDTSKRYFGTEHGSEVEMTPSAVNIKGGSSSPISISIDDAVGITVTSPKKLTLNADSEIIMKTPKNVKINGVSQINAVKTGTESGFSLEGDLHFLSDNVIKDGSSEESYPDFNDEPQAGVMPEPEPESKESGFSWGKLALVAVAAVAVVASVFTFGATATVAAVAIGAIAASAAVGAYKGAKNSIDSQKSANKDVNYLDVIKAAFYGAVTGATDMVKTEVCSAADWTVQTVLGTVGLLNEASKYLPFTRNNVAYQISADQTRDMLNNTSKYMHQFFKDLAPYQDAYEYGEDFLNLVSIANGVKSLGNMAQKGMGGISIGNMQIANTNIVVPALAYSGEAIAGVSDVASIAIAGSSMYNMSNSNGGTTSNSSSSGKKETKKEIVKDGEQYTRKGRKKVLKPDVEYTTKEGYKYTTDSQGNLSEVEGTLKLGDGKRNNYAQSHVGKGNGRLDTDDGGHLIATIFKGSGNIDNLVPMDSTLNRGAWKTMENTWARALKAGEQVKVKIKINYGSSSKRPSSFDIEYKIGEDDWIPQHFENH